MAEQNKRCIVGECQQRSTPKLDLPRSNLKTSIALDANALLTERSQSFCARLNKLLFFSFRKHVLLQIDGYRSKAEVLLPLQLSFTIHGHTFLETKSLLSKEIFFFWGGEGGGVSFHSRPHVPNRSKRASSIWMIIAVLPRWSR